MAWSYGEGGQADADADADADAEDGDGCHSRQPCDSIAIIGFGCSFYANAAA